MLAACGIDESGLLSGDSGADVTTGDVNVGDGGGGKDVVPVDNYVPPACTDPDASLDASCLGTTLPAGWVPFAMQVDASTVTCPGDGGDFAEVTYSTNPVIQGNNCVCTGCGTLSGWSCAGDLFAGPTCSEADAAVAATPYCWQVNHVFYGASVARTGTATCSPSTYFAQSASATSVAGCAPTRCQSDFCGLATQGFKLCARNDTVTDGGCPAGLPVSYIVGQNPSANCNACPTCSVANPNAACHALLTTFSSTDCDGGKLTQEVADGGCDMANGINAFGSMLYQPDVPVPQCTPSGPTNVGGNPTLAGPLTVCCVN